MQPWEGTVTFIHVAPGVFTVKWIWAELESWQQKKPTTHPILETSYLRILVFLFLLAFLTVGTCLDFLLSFCYIFCLLAIFIYVTFFTSLLFCSFACLLSCLWGAKQLLAFLLSFVCKVFGLGLPLLFSWEMAEAVFREGLEDLTVEENIFSYFQMNFLFLSLWNIWIHEASLIYKQHKQLNIAVQSALRNCDPNKEINFRTHAQTPGHFSSTQHFI